MPTVVHSSYLGIRVQVIQTFKSFRPSCKVHGLALILHLPVYSLGQYVNLFMLYIQINVPVFPKPFLSVIPKIFPDVQATSRLPLFPFLVSIAFNALPRNLLLLIILFIIIIIVSNRLPLFLKTKATIV